MRSYKQHLKNLFLSSSFDTPKRLKGQGQTIGRSWLKSNYWKVIVDDFIILCYLCELRTWKSPSKFRTASRFHYKYLFKLLHSQSNTTLLQNLTDNKETYHFILDILGRVVHSPFLLHFSAASTEIHDKFRFNQCLG